MKLLLACEDTTACSLDWAKHIPAGNPELLSQLHRAAVNALGEACVPMTFADTAKLGLFEGVALETMRTRAVAPLIFLETNESTELAGIEIPTPVLAFGMPRVSSRSDGSVRAKARVTDTTRRRSCISALDRRPSTLACWRRAIRKVPTFRPLGFVRQAEHLFRSN